MYPSSSYGYTKFNYVRVSSFCYMYLDNYWKVLLIPSKDTSNT